MRNQSRYIIDGAADPPDPGGGPVIPTYGAPASAFDGHAVYDIQVNGYRDINACFTDLSTQIALARLVQGEIRGRKDLQAAETALQIILFHDCVDVLVPAIKYHFLDNGLVGYERSPDVRQQLAYDLFQDLFAHDHLISQERITIENGLVYGSSLAGSRLLAQPFRDLSDGPLLTHGYQNAFYPAVCELFELPGYFSEPATEAYFDGRGFVQRFYESLRIPWEAAMSARPDLSLTVTLPPLVAVVLSYAVSRDTIPDAIRELRERTQAVRAELREFNQRLSSMTSEAEVQAEIRRLDTIFSAIIPAALQTNIEQRRRSLADLFGIFGAIKRPYDAIAKRLNPRHDGRNVRRLISKTISSKTFVGLFEMEPVASLCASHFSPVELRNLRRKEP